MPFPQINRVEANVLAALYDFAPHALTLSEIAERADWCQAAIRAAARACVAAGFIEAAGVGHRYSRGRFATTWRLTPKGRRLARNIGRDPVGMWERGEIVKEGV